MPLVSGESNNYCMCTIAACNSLRSVVLLAESFREHHPDIPMRVLLIDAPPAYETRDLPFEVILPADLPLDPDEFGRMATYYDVTEFSNALKPTLIRELLGSFSAVVYLNPDIEVFAGLTDLFELAVQHGIALTPHVMKPIPRDGLGVAEETILLSGQFNLGFIGVGASGMPFVDYWEERTRRLSLIDHASGYFTDQRWVDAVPSLFEHTIVRDPGCNVAYWNLHERALAHDGDQGWQVDGTPLRFFHFSGHDSARPLELTKHLGVAPRVRVDLEPALRRLLLERSERIRSEFEDACAPPYGFARTASGARLDPIVRRMYWHAVCQADREGTGYPPHAFGPDGGRSFVTWADEPVARTSPVSRYLLECWRARPDLQAAFPDPLGASSAALANWSSHDEQYSVTAPPAFLGAANLPATGVNLVGYLAGEFGLAAASRLMSRMVRGSGLPVASTTVLVDHHRHHAQSVRTLDGAPFDLSVVMINADQLLHLWDAHALIEHVGHVRAGVWYWEVGPLPEEARRAAHLLDEVWCASDFVRDILAPYVDRPVVKHPLVINPVVPTALRRADLELPEDRFLFGFVFDYSSVLERKNPQGLVEAYRRSFGPDDGASLVLKTIHSNLWPSAAAQLREAAAGRDDIIIIDRFASSLEMRALFQFLDCYVSLHRAEGLGLTITSAMSAGVPVIATGWSGNLEFMSSENSVLLPYELREVGAGAQPYPADACWADPDLDAAADAMRGLFDDRSRAAALGARAARDLAPAQTHGHGASWLLDRYQHLTGSRVA
jgi:glycosyltransferase involved in cell wall biosynthesis